MRVLVRSLWVLLFGTATLLAFDDKSNDEFEQGYGLKGEYFDGEEFEKLLFTRRDLHVDFLWGRGAIGPKLPADHFSVRWSGFIKAPIKGQYKLVFNADDRVRLTVDGKRLINAWAAENVGRQEATVALTGKPQPILIEYVEVKAIAYCALHWKTPAGGGELPVPTECLASDEKTLFRSPPRRKKSDRGLLMECFKGQALEKKVASEVVDGIHTYHGWAAPAPGAAHDQSSIRFTGWLTAPKSGRYVLVASGDEGCRVFLDDEVVIDSWNSRNESRAEVELDDKPMALRFEGHEDWYDASYMLLWQPPGDPDPSPIPASAFSVPSAVKRKRGK